MYDIESFPLGRIKFKRITKASLEEILEATKTLIRKTRHSPEEQELFIQVSNEDLSKEFSQDLRNCHMRSQTYIGQGKSERGASAGSEGLCRSSSNVDQSSQSIE
jgi:hypothetical protein